MEKIKYIDVYAKTLLNEVKDRVRQNRIIISGEKEIETDKKMIEVIKDTVCLKYNDNDQEKYFLNGLNKGSKEDTERIICTLILYYTALYNDNLELLNKLLENGFNFKNKRYELKLYVLDKKISSQFDIELYCDLLKNQSSVFENFHKSRHYDKTSTSLTDDEIINTFSRILNKDPQVAYSKSSDSSNQYVMSNLLTKSTICCFGEDIILNSTEEQKRNIICEARNYLPEESLNRLINLMKNHNYSIEMFCSWGECFKYFTDEELIMIDKLNKSEGINLFYKHYIRGTTGVDYEAIKKEIYLIKENSQSKAKTKKRILDFFRRK